MSFAFTRLWGSTVHRYRMPSDKLMGSTPFQGGKTMNRIGRFLIRTSIIAMALVILGWILGLAVPAQEVTDETTKGLAPTRSLT